MTLIKLLPSPNSFLCLTFLEGSGKESRVARAVPGSEVCAVQSMPNPVIFYLRMTAAQGDAKDEANLGYRASSKLKEVWGQGI